MNDDKLLNLAGAKVLYDDLRDRIEQAGADGVVRYDTSQELTEAQKEQARDNINAAGIEQVDEEFTEIHDDIRVLTENNSKKLCDNTAVADKTDAGITFTWDGNTQCTITGTSSSSAASSNSCATAKPLPTDEIYVGGTYFIHFKSTGTKARAMAEWWIDNPGGFPRQGSQIITGDTMFTVSAGATSLYLKVHVPANSGAVNETIEIGIYSAPTNLQLYEKSVTDVQVNGASVVTDGVANVPVADANNAGVAKVDSNYGVGFFQSTNKLSVISASTNEIKVGGNSVKPITPWVQHVAAFYGLATASGDTTQRLSSNAVGTYTETAKSKISEMLSSPVSVTGTTPTITALSGIQYVCGEVSTLDITLPASGIVDVVFESGSTPTVLTITPPTGMTVEWANGFDSTALDADTLYEINIKMVGSKCLGVAGAWS